MHPAVRTGRPVLGESMLEAIASRLEAIAIVRLVTTQKNILVVVVVVVAGNSFGGRLRSNGVWEPIRIRFGSDLGCPF